MKGKRFSNVEFFLDMQTGMGSLVIDWDKEEPKMAQLILHIYVLVI